MYIVFIEMLGKRFAVFIIYIAIAIMEGKRTVLPFNNQILYNIQIFI